MKTTERIVEPLGTYEKVGFTAEAANSSALEYSLAQHQESSSYALSAHAVIDVTFPQLHPRNAFYPSYGSKE